MSYSRCLMVALLAGAIAVGPACTQKAADATKKDVGAALDATKVGADKALDATKSAGAKTAEVAGTVADKSKDIALAAGAEVTDSWITTKLKAKFADETVLEGSAISVSTTNHVVTLKGTVPSGPAETRAVEIARGTQGVTRVVNQIVVRGQ